MFRIAVSLSRGILKNGYHHQKLYLHCLTAQFNSRRGCIGFGNVPCVNLNVRSFCNQSTEDSKNEPPPTGLPVLMDFPPIMWPNTFKSIKNFILARFIIAAYFEREFSVTSFLAGAKQAVVHITNCLAAGDFNSLDGLVTVEAITELRKSLDNYSVQQRESLKIDLQDIYFGFIYQIGIMFDDSPDEQQKRFVEITITLHTIRGIESFIKSVTDSKSNVGPFGFNITKGNDDLKDKLMVCNFRFIREFTKGVDSSWVVNVVNVFRPSDMTR